ncbi:MAG: hypothetical protein OXF72_00050 [Gammaproteobacteria bacterium]|nr:hypothetical protein [Gammaproteobacteria bacterium]MCY4322279.1 hypothetical protein [Gammaproteobacteria bacterium]
MNAYPARLPTTLLAGLLGLVVCVAQPLQAETDSLQAETDSLQAETDSLHAATDYHTFNDRQLTEVLQKWGTLDSADRRGLLVELRKRMQRAEYSNRAPHSAMPNASNQSRLRPGRITIQIRVRQTMRFGAGIGSEGVLVVRSENMPNVSHIKDARHLLAQMRARMARAEPLPGPGFGDGFERRQDYIKASLLGDETPK